MRDIRALRTFALALLLAGCGVVSNNPVTGDSDNPGDTDQGPITIADLRNPASPKHPASGTSVILKNVVVTAATPYVDDNTRVNFWVQDAGGPWHGIYVYDRSFKIPRVAVGDVVEVHGTYAEYTFTGDTKTVSEIYLTNTVTPTESDHAPAAYTMTPDDLGRLYTDADFANSMQAVLVNVAPTDGLTVLEISGSNSFRVGTSMASSVVVTDEIWADVDANRGINQPVSALSGVIWRRYGDIKLEPRTPQTDIAHLLVNDFTAGDIPTTVTDVYHVRDRSLAGAMMPGTLVQLSGMVVTAREGSGTGSFFAQLPALDPAYTGIYVSRATSSSNPAVEVGDVVTIAGAYQEDPSGVAAIASLSKIVSASVEVTATGAVPDAAVVAPEDIVTGGAHAEDYESVLVRVEGVSVAAASTSGYQVDAGLPLDMSVFPGIFDLSSLIGLDPIASIQGPLAFKGANVLAVTALDSTAAPYPASTIREIQTAVVAPDTRLRIDGVVTALVSSSTGDFFLQMVVNPGDSVASTGIYVTRLSSVTTQVAVGDLVTVEGRYTKVDPDHPGWYALTKFTAKSITKTGTTTPPVPTVVAAATLASLSGGMVYESVLVRVENVGLVLPANPDSPSDYAEFKVTGGLRVGSIIFGSAATFSRVSLDGFDYINGPLYYSRGAFKIEPRGSDDLGRKPIPATVTSVYALQDRTDASAVAVGTQVELDDVVITAVVGQGDGSFWVQVPDAAQDARGARFSGIYCDRGTGGASLVVAAGDVIKLTGLYVEEPDASPVLSAVLVDQVTINSTGAALPTAEPVDIAGLSAEPEPYEGVLLALAELDLLAANPTANELGEFTVGSTGAPLLVGTSAAPQLLVPARRAVAGFTSLGGILTQSVDGYSLEATALQARSIPTYTIYDLRDPAATPPVGKGVAVQNVVVTGAVGAGSGTFFVELQTGLRDQRGARFSGIRCERTQVSHVDPDVAVTQGDIVSLEGTLVQKDGLTSLQVSRIVKAGTTGAAAVELLTDDSVLADPATALPYDGVLVQLQGVPLDTAYPDDPDQGAFTVGISTTAELRVSPLLNAAATDLGRRAVAGFDVLSGVLEQVSATSFQLLPRPGELTAAAIPVKTIYQVQDESDVDHPAPGTGVKIVGAQVSAFVSGTTGDFFLQMPNGVTQPDVYCGAYQAQVTCDADAYCKWTTTCGPKNTPDARGMRFSGVYCKRQPVELPDAVYLHSKDVVTVEGTYLETGGLTQLRVSRITVTKLAVSADPALAIMAVTPPLTQTDAEAYEGVLVSIANATVVNPMPDDPDRGEVLLSGDLRAGSLIMPVAAINLATATAIASLAGPLHYNLGNWVIEPRTWGDVAATLAPRETTPYEIQDPAYNFPKADVWKPSGGTETANCTTVGAVTLKGLVVTGVVPSATYPFKAYYAQVPPTSPAYKGPEYSGIYVYAGAIVDATGAATPATAPVAGDVIDVTGGVMEYYNLTEMSYRANCSASVSTTINAHGAPVPAPVVLTSAQMNSKLADLEKYESVFVRLENVYLLVQNPDGTSEYNEFGVGPQGSATYMRVDDLVWAYGTTLLATFRAQTTFSFVQGLITYAAPASYKLEPRGAYDIQYP